MEISDRLKQERERLKLTQTEFGQLGDAGKTTVIAWERGTAYPNAAFLAAVAKAGADIQYIVTGERAAKAGPQPPLDTALLRDCIQVLTEGFANRQRKPSSAQMAEAILLAYEIARGDGKVMKEKFEPILRLVA